MINNTVACVANVARFYGIDLELAQLRQNLKRNKSFEKLAKENGLKLKKVFCKNLKFPDDIIFPVVAEVNSGGNDATDLSYCFIVKRKGDTIYTITAQGRKTIRLPEFEKIFSGTLYVMTPKKDFTHAHAGLKDIGRFFILLKSEKKNFTKIFIASVMLCLFGVLTAFYFRFLIDEVLNAGLHTMLNSFTFAFFVVITFQALLGFARNQLLNFMGHRIDATIVTEYFSHVFQLPIRFFSKIKTGEIISRMFDGTTIRNLISATFLSVMIDAVMLVFGAAFLFLFGSKLLLVTIASVVCGAITAKLFARPYRQKLDERARAEAVKQSCMVEFVNGIESLKAIGAVHTASNICEEKIIRASKKNVSMQSMSNFQNTVQFFIQKLGTLFIYWFGGQEIINGKMSLGQLISFVILSQYFIGPLFRFLTLQPTLQEAETAARRLAEIFDEKVEEEKGRKICDACINGEIECNNVSFSYENNKNEALSNISFKIKRGERVAFVGESGSGKSTIAKLLMKFQNISSGEILLDGKNLNDYSIDLIRNKIGYIPQDSILFSGTVYDNIALGNDDASADDIFTAAADSQADKFIRNLPNRYDSIVGERGTTLSGGERQRLAIARTMLKNPDMFILDESTSALDSMLEASVMEALESKAENKTMIVISHKLSTVKNFDKIFVLDNGKIIESGTHNELLLLNGKYSELWYTQNMEVLHEKTA